MAADINPADIANILTQLTAQPYITQEVGVLLIITSESLFTERTGCLRCGATSYTSFIYWEWRRPRVGSFGIHLISGLISLFRRFRYTFTLRGAFLTGGISSLQDLDNQGWVAGSGANVFVSNHDTERVRPAITSPSFIALTPRRTWPLSMHTHPQIRTPWLLSSPCIGHHICSRIALDDIPLVFYSAHPYGTPTVLSSYDTFYDYDSGAPNGGTIRLASYH